LAAVAALGALLGACDAAQAVPLTNGLTLTVGTIQYTFNSCSVTGAGTFTPTACSALQVAADTQGGADGFSLSGLIAAVGPASHVEVDLSYTAVNLDPLTAIDSITMSQTGSVSALANMDDSVRSQTNTLEADLLTSGVSPVVTDPVAQFLKTLKFTQKIDVAGSSKPCVVNGKKTTCNVTNQISFIQILPHVARHHRHPEPATVAVFGMGLLATSWIVARRTRRSAKA
jgi:hypothetical protein